MSIPSLPRLRLVLLGVACLLPPLGPTAARAEVPPDRPIRVAIYDTSGAKKRVDGLDRFLTETDGFRSRRVTPAEIRDGCLRNFDVLLMPGGSARNQADRLGALGRDNIRAFVKDGGGYVGICAGSYLATTHYAWSLGLINARVVDREHWARGHGQVQLKLTPAGQQGLDNRSKEVAIQYWQGPLLAPGTRSDLPAYETMATFATEIAKNGSPRGVMVGTTAIARTQSGRGRVVCYSPHPEKAGGPHHLLSAGIRWAAGRPSLVAQPLPANESAAAGTRVAKVIDGMDVEHHWLPGLRVNWRTGTPTNPHRRFATHCSAFVAAACDRLGVYILRPPDHSQSLLANAQQRWLLTSGEAFGWKEVKHADQVQTWQKAQELANKGYVVVASYRNADVQRPGHVAIVRASDKSAELIAREGPEMAWAGRRNASHGSLIEGFRSHPKEEVRFFYHRSKEQ